MVSWRGVVVGEVTVSLKFCLCQGLAGPRPFLGPRPPAQAWHTLGSLQLLFRALGQPGRQLGSIFSKCPTLSRGRPPARV